MPSWNIDCHTVDVKVFRNFFADSTDKYGDSSSVETLTFDRSAFILLDAV